LKTEGMHSSSPAWSKHSGAGPESRSGGPARRPSGLFTLIKRALWLATLLWPYFYLLNRAVREWQKGNWSWREELLLVAITVFLVLDLMLATEVVLRALGVLPGLRIVRVWAPPGNFAWATFNTAVRN